MDSEALIQFKILFFQSCISQHTKLIDKLSLDRTGFKELKPPEGASEKDFTKWADSLEKLSDNIYQAQKIISTLEKHQSEFLKTKKHTITELDYLTLFKFSIYQDYSLNEGIGIVLPLKKISQIQLIKVNDSKVRLFPVAAHLPHFIGKPVGIVGQKSESEILIGDGISREGLKRTGKFKSPFKAKILRILG